MKICFLIRRLGFGGAERQLVNLANGLQSREYEVEIITFYPGGELAMDCKNKKIKLTHLNKHGRWDLLGFVWRLMRALSTARADVVLPFSTAANLFGFFASLLLKRKPVVIWRIATSVIDYGNYDWTARLLYKIECRLSRYVPFVISNSEAGRQHAIANGFAAPTITCIPNGIEVEIPNLTASKRQEIRDSMHCGIDDFLVALVGRIDPMKGHRDFVEAAGLLRQNHPRLRFACIGSGNQELKEELTSLARAKGLEDVMTWLPATTNIASVYTAIDALVCASLGEGFPNVVAEAMICGVPVIGTDVGDISEILQNSELVIGAGKPKQMAAKIAWLVEMDHMAQEKLVVASQARVRDHYSVTRYVDRISDYLAQIRRETPG
jgi:glycosyltransferase involved in cell wall biosynthesis